MSNENNKNKSSNSLLKNSWKIILILLLIIIVGYYLQQHYDISDKVRTFFETNKEDLIKPTTTTTILYGPIVNLKSDLVCDKVTGDEIEGKCISLCEEDNKKYIENYNCVGMDNNVACKCQAYKI